MRETGPDIGESTAVEWSPLKATVPVVTTDAVNATGWTSSVSIWARCALSRAIASGAPADAAVSRAETAAVSGFREQPASETESAATAASTREGLADMLVSRSERVEWRCDGALEVGPRAAGRGEGIGVLAFGVEQPAAGIEHF